MSMMPADNSIKTPGFPFPQPIPPILQPPPPPHPKVTAPGLLRGSIETLDRCASEYDQPQGERSMAHCVEIFNAITGQQMTERDGWTFMMALKLARSRKGEPKADTYVDLAAYAALEGECRL